MRVSLDWLAEFIDLPEAEALVERLNLGGFEDAEIEASGPDLSAIVVGHVVECARHPNADRLSLCSVDLGTGEPIDIVCGAPNVAAGQKVAVAPPGSVLPDGSKLKRTKIRGVHSNGMICSERELGISEEADGILVLDGAAPVGAPLPEVVRVGARVLEVGITPNRGDAASLLGVGREVRAHFGGSLREPETVLDERGAPSSDAIVISIEEPDLCHQYVARVVRGVRVGPSPDWLRQRLEASGIRSIDNVVDVTNYALLELGQPLHAFDLSKLRGATVCVRRARAGEKFAGLDGKSRTLDPEDLVIADAERAIALAGVMGGSETQVGVDTRDVLIESAHFHPTAVRLSARRHGLHTEASYRFERGVDRAGVARAADRAARLLAEIAEGEVAKGAVQVEGGPPVFSETVSLEIERVNRLLGVSLGRDEIVALLARLEIVAEPEGEGVLSCRIPSYRNDLHLHQDLIEEVARIYGYERIPATEPVAPLQAVQAPPLWLLGESTRDALAGAGLIECRSLPFLRPEDVAGLGLPADSPLCQGLRVANPIKEEEGLLRTTLLPSLLGLARQNLSRQIDRVRLFEVSRVFLPRGKGELPAEPLWASALLTAGAEPVLWRQNASTPLFFEVKGVAERLLFLLGYEASMRAGPTPSYLHPGAAAEIEVEGQVVGNVGEIHPEVASRFELGATAAVLELDLSALAGLTPCTPRYREVSRQPSVRRDLAVVLDRDQPAGTVLEAIRKTAGADLVSAELFDRYEGKGMPEGRVSLAFRLVFQRSDRTLKDAEVTRAVERVVRMLAHRFNGELR